MSNQDAVKLRNTNPKLYRDTATLAAIAGLLALNYWFGPPATFNPYGIDRNVVAGIFALLAAATLLNLTLIHHLRLTRILLALEGGFTLLWGWANTQQTFAGNASFAIPIFCLGLAILHLWALIDSPVNPTTRRADPEPTLEPEPAP